MVPYSDRTDHHSTKTGPLTTSEPLSASSSNSPSQPPLGLLDDANLGHQATDSKDVAILRRLKLAILEGQHPYFKANVDLSNLQDLVLATSASRVTNPAHQSELPKETALVDPTHTFAKDGTSSPANAVLRSPIAKVVNGHSKHDKSGAETSLDQRLHDFEMNNVEPNETRMTSNDFSADTPRGPASEKNLDSKNTQPGSFCTLGRHTLLSPIESESASGALLLFSAFSRLNVATRVWSQTKYLGCFDCYRHTPTKRRPRNQHQTRIPSISALWIPTDRHRPEFFIHILIRLCYHHVHYVNVRKRSHQHRCVRQD
jgi:hypothetical protein